MADLALAAELSNTKGVAAVRRKVGRLSARGRDLTPARVTGRVRRPVSHLFDGPLSASISTRQRREGYTARRLVTHGRTLYEAFDTRGDHIAGR